MVVNRSLLDTLRIEPISITCRMHSQTSSVRRKNFLSLGKSHVQTLSSSLRYYWTEKTPSCNAYPWLSIMSESLKIFYRLFYFLLVHFLHLYCVAFFQEHLTGVIASSHFIPVTDGSRFLTSCGSTIVNTSVILTGRCATTRTFRGVALHVGTDTFLWASFVFGTGGEWGTWFAAINPIDVFQLIIATGVGVDIPRTSQRSAARFNFTDAVEAFVIDLSPRCRAQGHQNG